MQRVSIGITTTNIAYPTGKNYQSIISRGVAQTIIQKDFGCHEISYGGLVSMAYELIMQWERTVSIPAGLGGGRFFWYLLQRLLFYFVSPTLQIALFYIQISVN
jgi:hypothetical protein